MNIVKFLETMKEDAERCKSEFKWIKENTWSYACDSTHTLALEMIGKYGCILVPLWEGQECVISG